MLKKVLFLILATALCLEVLVRLTLIVPDIYPWEYQDHTVFIRKSFDGVVPINSNIQLSGMWRWGRDKGPIPSLMSVQTDEFAFRRSNAESVSEPGVLLLGDSVSFGWPYSFEDSHLGVLSRESSVPFSACAFNGAGAVVLAKVIESRCQISAPWKKVVLQLTINNEYSFPDVFFLDRMGTGFHSKFSYFLFNKNAGDLDLKNWSMMSPEKEKEVDEFSQVIFNGNNDLYSSAAFRLTWLTAFYRPLKNPVTQLAQLAKMVEGDSVDDRVARTLQAVLKIRSHFQQPFIVYLHYTHPAAMTGKVRPEVELLKQQLAEADVIVYDQALEPEYIAMKPLYYLPMDLHPNRQGYGFFAKNLMLVLEIPAK